MWDLPHAEAATLDEARRLLAESLGREGQRRLAAGASGFEVRHTIMARRIVRHVFVVALRTAPLTDGAWVEVPDAGGRPLTSTARKCLSRLARLAGDRA
jgi:hypothetical protein